VPSLPDPRGELSLTVIDALREPVGAVVAPEVAVSDPLGDEDLQLALYCCYELHYRGFDGVDPEWEWEPSLLAVRRDLERAFEAALRDAIGGPRDRIDPGEMDLALRAIADADESPSVSRYVERHAPREHLLEFLVHRSAYQLKEADPHSFAIPRLSGPPKAAMVEIQADEYGGGRPDRIHADLFATTLRSVGLDDRYGAYLDRIPATTLATVNLVSLFGLHRRWRGAAAGHLALFEMGSSLPSGRYARGMRRLGCPEEGIDFFDEHVIADAVHENIAAVDLAGGLARLEPDIAADVLWGARTSMELDGRAARRMMDAWEAGESSLLAAGMPVA
jgi:Iron-containing redox enzyme